MKQSKLGRTYVGAYAGDTENGMERHVPLQKSVELVLQCDNDAKYHRIQLWRRRLKQRDPLGFLVDHLNMFIILSVDSRNALKVSCSLPRSQTLAFQNVIRYHHAHFVVVVVGILDVIDS
jgi:hypothetical protein